MTIQSLKIKSIKEACLNFWNKETVLCLSLAAAAFSALFTAPSLKYIKYINFDVLEMLFCLMAATAGLQKIGFFTNIALWLKKHIKNTGTLTLLLTAVCFMLSMLITNDVALIVFVPFTIQILGTQNPKNLIFTIVMETAAANLGSMATPIGNPQNLFLYSCYNLNLNSFFKIMTPWSLISLIMILGTMAIINKVKFSDIKSSENPQDKAASIPALKLTEYFAAFALCILAIAKIISASACFLIILIFLAAADRKVLKSIDYMLLLTFVCFFVFVGNISSSQHISSFLSRILQGHELFLGALISQIISNVPAAVMLASFTDNAEALLLGVNLGGLGTLVGSLASLISYKLYCRTEGAQKSLYLKVFSLINFSYLAVLLILAELFA